ncbi:MAG: hypothetical protein ACRC8A_09930 [Microcoleaceae cyanobacterium]
MPAYFGIILKLSVYPTMEQRLKKLLDQVRDVIQLKHYDGRSYF